MLRGWVPALVHFSEQIGGVSLSFFRLVRTQPQRELDLPLQPRFSGLQLSTAPGHLGHVVREAGDLVEQRLRFVHHFVDLGWQVRGSVRVL